VSSESPRPVSQAEVGPTARPVAGGPVRIRGIVRSSAQLAQAEPTETPAYARGSMFAAMAVAPYPRLWAIGLIVSLTRWMTIFLSSYLINDLTHSAILVQLVGVSLFAPLFAGGLVAGAISDRLDRRRTLITILSVLLVGALVMAFFNLSGMIEVWLVYPFVLAVGTGHVLDMTSRRALVYDCVGPRVVTNALALESMAMMGGTVIGGLTAGTIISVLGIGAVFLAISVLYCTALLLLLGLRTAPRHRPVEVMPDFMNDLVTGFRYVRSHRALVSVLGVTILMNLFYFSYTPMVPIFGEKLGVGPFWSGLLLSAHGLGSVIGASVIASGLRLGRGWTYVGGSAFALMFLFLFAAMPWYPAALIALMVAGFGIAGFATMQSVLVMISAEDEMRGRAMGMLSMSIGALPFSMLLLGAYATAVGPAVGVMTSVSIGLVALVAFSIWRPEARNLS
jgi:MFS family permease